MKLEHIFEKDTARVPHPQGERVDNIGDIMDDFSDIEWELASTMYPTADYPNMKPSDKVSATIQHLKDKGKTADVDISKLNHLEPDLVQKNVEFFQSNSIESLPTVYNYNDNLYVNDGNHRVAAAFKNGDKTIKVNLVDLTSVAKSLNFNGEG